ncbi:MAG: hypothetical protein ACOCX9_01030 [Spirochaetota bacterium]
MSVKPIDLQVHIAQVTEVARGEQARQSALLEQQHVLEKEAKDKANLQKERVEENKRSENEPIRDNEKESGRGQKGRKKRKKSDAGSHDGDTQKVHTDDTIGRIIDIRK